MQKLTLYEDVFDALALGKKTTIRKGNVSIALGELLFQSTEVHREAVVHVKKVYSCLLNEVIPDDLSNDGFIDHQDMAEKMKRFYPDITLESEVTVIKFDMRNK
jgi:hypothetical protein